MTFLENLNTLLSSKKMDTKEKDMLSGFATKTVIAKKHCTEIDCDISEILNRTGLYDAYVELINSTIDMGLKDPIGEIEKKEAGVH